MKKWILISIVSIVCVAVGLFVFVTNNKEDRASEEESVSQYLEYEDFVSGADEELLEADTDFSKDDEYEHDCEYEYDGNSGDIVVPKQSGADVFVNQEEFLNTVPEEIRDIFYDCIAPDMLEIYPDYTFVSYNDDTGEICAYSEQCGTWVYEFFGGYYVGYAK